MNGKKTGGRKLGTPNRATADVRELAQDYGKEAETKLVEIMRTAPNFHAQVAAARELLDRGYCKSRFIGTLGHHELPKATKEQRDAACAAAMRADN